MSLARADRFNVPVHGWRSPVTTPSRCFLIPSRITSLFRRSPQGLSRHAAQQLGYAAGLLFLVPLATCLNAVNADCLHDTAWRNADHRQQSVALA